MQGVQKISTESAKHVIPQVIPNRCMSNHNLTPSRPKNKRNNLPIRYSNVYKPLVWRTDHMVRGW